MQKMIFNGNLTRDVELTQTKSGKAIAKFNVAVKRPFSKENTDFFDVIAYEGLAETCNNYLAKGNKVLVEGYMTTHTYEDKEGTKRKAYEVRALAVEFLSKTVQNQEQALNEEEHIEGLPF